MDETKISPNGHVYAALAAIQAEVPTVQRDGVNPHFRSSYSTLPTIWAAVKPLIAKNGCVLFNKMDKEGVVTTLAHVDSGETIESFFPVAAGLNAQQLGSAISYAKRYNLASMLMVMSGDDDDGNLAASPAPKPAPAAAKPAPAPAQTAKVMETVAAASPYAKPAPAPVDPSKDPWQHAPWSQYSTDRLEKALGCTEPRLTDAHKAVIKKLIDERAAAAKKDEEEKAAAAALKIMRDMKAAGQTFSIPGEDK